MSGQMMTDSCKGILITGREQDTWVERKKKSEQNVENSEKS
jgi:hypothetical protein